MQLRLPLMTELCLIRDYKEEDIPFLADIEFDTATKAYVGLPKFEKQVWISHAEKVGVRGWAVVALPEVKLAGRVCLTLAKDGTEKIAEFEVVIDKRFWGRRLGREAAKLVIPAAFREHDILSLRAEVHPENEASLKLLQSCGFTYTGHAIKWPMLMYEVRRSECLL